LSACLDISELHFSSWHLCILIHNTITEQSSYLLDLSTLSRKLSISLLLCVCVRTASVALETLKLRIVQSFCAVADAPKIDARARRS
jgi:hypothetical protein